MKSWIHDVASGTETGDLACATDWASTALGDPDHWPAGLRSAVETCFSTRFPVLVTWGPRLTMIYNDGYREMLGSDLHPAMGADAPEVWSSVWPDVAPLFDAVLSTSQPTWNEDMPLVMNRSGFNEETTFTFSYSPLRDDSGVVCGVMDISTETTAQVINRRRLETLNTVSTTLHEQRAKSVGDLARVTAATLADSADVACTEIHLGSDLAARSGVRDDHPDAAARAAVRRSALHQWVGDTLVYPLAGSGDMAPIGTVTLTRNTHRPFDGEQRNFLILVARTIAVALAGAHAIRRELRRIRTVGDALQEAMAPTPLASPRWQTRYRPADSRLSVGGDWFDVVDRGDGTSALVVGDCVGHGLEAATRMGRLSSAGSAALHNGTDPARTLTILDRYSASLPGAEFATVFCGVVDPVAGTLVYASAGHPPALLVRADGTTAWLDESQGPPLTLSDNRVEVTIDVHPGDTVVLYTDGLVERRDESLVDGLARLADIAPEICTGPVEDIPDRLLDVMLPHTALDDVAIVAYRA